MSYEELEPLASDWKVKLLHIGTLLFDEGSAGNMRAKGPVF